MALMEELDRKKKKRLTPATGYSTLDKGIPGPPEQDISTKIIPEPTKRGYGTVTDETTGQKFSAGNQRYSRGDTGLAVGGGSFSVTDIKESTTKPAQQQPSVPSALMRNIPSGIMQPQTKARTELIDLKEGEKLGMGWQARRSANREILRTQGNIEQQGIVEQGRIGVSRAQAIGQQNIDAARANLPEAKAKAGLAQHELGQAPLMAEMDRLSLEQVRKQISGEDAPIAESENLQDILNVEHGESPARKKRKDLMQPGISFSY